MVVARAGRKLALPSGSLIWYHGFHAQSRNFGTKEKERSSADRTVPPDPGPVRSGASVSDRHLQDGGLAGHQQAGGYTAHRDRLSRPTGAAESGAEMNADKSDDEGSPINFSVKDGYLHWNGQRVKIHHRIDWKGIQGLF